VLHESKPGGRAGNNTIIAMWGAQRGRSPRPIAKGHAWLCACAAEEHAGIRTAQYDGILRSSGNSTVPSRRMCVPLPLCPCIPPCATCCPKQAWCPCLFASTTCLPSEYTGSGCWCRRAALRWRMRTCAHGGCAGHAQGHLALWCVHVRTGRRAAHLRACSTRGPPEHSPRKQSLLPPEKDSSC